MHVIRLGVTHSEIDTEYGLRHGFQLSLRLPYDIKDQHVHYTTLDGAPSWAWRKRNTSICNSEPGRSSRICPCSRLARAVSLSARVEARLSLYESSKGYHGPTTFVWSLGPSFQKWRISIGPGLNGQYQTLARWHGTVEEGSGFNAGGVRLQFGVPIGSVVLSPGIYRELWSRGFAEQTFNQGAWSIGITRTLP